MGSKKKKNSGRPGGGPAVPKNDSDSPVAEETSAPRSGQRTFSLAFFSSIWFEWGLISSASILFYLILTARHIGVNVSVLTDEYSYVLDSHFKGFAEARYPNHLFQLVFSTTKECGAEFYSCARSLNAVFVIAGAIFVYLLAKHVSGKKWLGSLAAIAAILGSYGTYTAYFMPEAIFNFPMIVFYWALVRFGNSNSLGTWAGFGSILGIASLAKPHAFFVVPALMAFIFLWTRATQTKFLFPALFRIAAFGVSSVVIKFGVGYLIAGPKALSIFGSYGGAISTGEAVATTLGASTWLNVPATAWGQTLMVTMILGFALPVAIMGFLDIFNKNASVAQANRVRALVGISLVNMMAVVAVFEAWQNISTWMHTRYYSYLIPLAIVALVEAYSKSSVNSNPVLKRIVVGVFLVLASMALLTAAVPYGANWIDAPDFKFHIDNLVMSSILIVTSILLAIWWLWNSKLPLMVGLIVSLVASALAGTHISNFLIKNFGQDRYADQLGRVLRNYLPQEELDKTVLIGDSGIEMQRALFGALSGGATAIKVREDVYNVSELTRGTRWVVKVGEPNVVGLDEPVILGPGYSIHSLSKSNSLKPKTAGEFTVTESCTNPTNQGWLCGASAEIRLREAALTSAEVDILIDVSNEAAKSEIEFELGGSRLRLTGSPGILSFTLNFDNSEPASAIFMRSTAGDLPVESEETRFIRVISVIEKR